MINLKIIDGIKLIYDEDVINVKCKTDIGINIVAMDYIPMLSVLAKNEQEIVVTKTDFTKEKFHVKGGVLQVEKNKVVILTRGE